MVTLLTTEGGAPMVTPEGARLYAVWTVKLIEVRAPFAPVVMPVTVSAPRFVPVGASVGRIEAV